LRDEFQEPLAQQHVVVGKYDPSECGTRLHRFGVVHVPAPRPCARPVRRAPNSLPEPATSG